MEKIIKSYHNEVWNVVGMTTDRENIVIGRDAGEAGGTTRHLQCFYFTEEERERLLPGACVRVQQELVERDGRPEMVTRARIESEA